MKIILRCLFVMTICLFQMRNVYAHTNGEYYKKMGMPSLDQKWEPNDYKKFLVSVQKIVLQHPKRLPSLQNTGKPYFLKLIDPTSIPPQNSILTSDMPIQFSIRNGVIRDVTMIYIKENNLITTSNEIQELQNYLLCSVARYLHLLQQASAQIGSQEDQNIFNQVTQEQSKTFVMFARSFLLVWLADYPKIDNKRASKILASMKTAILEAKPYLKVQDSKDLQNFLSADFTRKENVQKLVNELKF